MTLSENWFDQWKQEDDLRKAKQAREDSKQARKIAVDAIEVNYGGVIYQGDEVSQERMARSLIGLEDGEVINWGAKDNTVHSLQKSDLKEILRQAGQMQSNIWFIPS